MADIQAYPNMILWNVYMMLGICPMRLIILLSALIGLNNV